MATRNIDCTDRDEADAIYSLISDLAQCERDLHATRLDLQSARTRNRTLYAELRRAIEAPKLIGQQVVDGMLTVTYSNGRVVQLQPTAYYHEHSTEYRHEWRDLVPAPDTAKAIVAATLDDDDLDALPFLGGMAVEC
jgi:hypothetical protein